MIRRIKVLWIDLILALYSIYWTRKRHSFILTHLGVTDDDIRAEMDKWHETLGVSDD